MDAARTAREGADEVYVLYRKGFENMTCTKAELEEAKEDGVSLNYLKHHWKLQRKVLNT